MKVNRWKLNVTSALIAISTSIVASAMPSAASSGGPGAYLSELWSDAQRRGIPRVVFKQAFQGFEISPRIIDLTRKQPESVSTVQDYIDKRVSVQRVDTGRSKLLDNSTTLDRIERAYGVPSEVIVAIWGLETNYGGFLGGSNVVHALATLAHEGYRGNYFRDELMTALEIVRDGHIRSNEMVGSWAGAMGQTQFMPSSFIRYAVDFDEDGRADLWNSIPDSLASSGNYLKENGWRHGEAWGYEVQLPADFDYATAWSADRLTLREWQRLGIGRADGQRFPRPDDPARLFLPAGGSGPAFLLLRNFDVIKRYNSSDSYALSVGHLANRLAGAGPFVTDWPTGVLPLTTDERKELQTLLAEEGFYSGEIDGRIGSKTRLAIIRFQQQQNIRADAFPTKRLLQILRVQTQNASLME